MVVPNDAVDRYRGLLRTVRHRPNENGPSVENVTLRVDALAAITEAEGQGDSGIELRSGPVLVGLDVAERVGIV